ncbi:hypothetical protein PG994_015333 [Apiospora phragmitis]|uniref:Uncharacterized protein n=1 Tax=Apiospora phragmitis TaxID=2905665 RepID=A0ABR1SR94_9PEZI
MAEFIDAGFGYNNPCEVCISEAKKPFLDHSQLQILSIGAGHGDVVEIQDSRLFILKALRWVTLSSTATANRVGSQYGDGGQYHRFNVERGLVDVAFPN